MTGDDERRAEIEAVARAVARKLNSWLYAVGLDTAERVDIASYEIAEVALDAVRVRDARGDDEAALNSMWSIMQTQFERGRTPECHGPTRDDAHKMLAGLHRVAARSPQGEEA
jgi:hypothetical protein